MKGTRRMRGENEMFTNELIRNTERKKSVIRQTKVQMEGKY